MNRIIAAIGSFDFGRQRKPDPYRPLQAADSIRIVHLFKLEGRLHGRLEEVRLSEKPTYVALSYVWGAAIFEENSNTTKPFYLDGEEIQVTSNLADFVEAIIAGTTSVPPHWIDAICINQADDAEKSVQLQMMREIYEKAGGVLIWLGKHDEKSRENIEKLYTSYEISVRCDKHYDNVDSALADPAWLREVGLLSEDGSVLDREGWESLGRFFRKRKWWHRMWTVQEYLPVVSQRFMCGNTVFQPKLLRATLLVEGRLSSVQGFEFLDRAGFGIPFRIERFRQIANDGPPLSFYELLCRCRHRSATDPRDKVFAPLGLLPREQRLEGCPKIDYALTASMLFTRVAEYLSKTARNLDWLEAVCPSTASECPSWVPDWGLQSTLAPFPKILRSGDSLSRSVYSPWGNGDSDNWNEEMPRVDSTATEAELHLTGVLIDEITTLYDVSKGDVGVVQSWIERACREREAYELTGEAILRAVLRTIVFDVGTVDVDAYIRQPQNLDQLVGLPIQDIVHELLFGSPDNWRDSILVDVRRGIQNQRRFAETRNGFIGVVPPHARVGDKIFAFAGGRVLYVVRDILKPPKRYYFVGESYVHGLMDGEWRDGDAFGRPSCIVLV